MEEKKLKDEEFIKSFVKTIYEQSYQGMRNIESQAVNLMIFYFTLVSVITSFIGISYHFKIFALFYMVMVILSFVMFLLGVKIIQIIINRVKIFVSEQSSVNLIGGHIFIRTSEDLLQKVLEGNITFYKRESFFRGIISIISMFNSFLLSISLSLFFINYFPLKWRWLIFLIGFGILFLIIYYKQIKHYNYKVEEIGKKEKEDYEKWKRKS